MEKVKSLNLIKNNILANFKTIKKMEKASNIMKMERFTMEIGLMIKEMDKEFYIQIKRLLKENGKMIK